MTPLTKRSLTISSFSEQGQKIAVPAPVTSLQRSISAKKPAQRATEKRFFKNFDDFKDFDPNLKHKIPIGGAEFELLDQFIPEHPVGAWQIAVDKGSTRIYKQIVNVGGSDLVMVKGYAHFEGVTIENMIYNLRDLGRRTIWDKTFDGFTLVEASVFGNEITYNSIHAPWPVADREFLQWRRMSYVFENGATAIDGGENAAVPNVPIKECRIMHRSADHPGYPISKSASIIRAESVISAYVFKKTPSGVDMMLLTQCDIKGVVPKWLVNSQAAKAPVQWVENFRNACSETKSLCGSDPHKIPKYTPNPQYTNAIKVDLPI